MKTLKYIVPILLMVTLSRTSCNKEDDDKVVPTAVTLTQVEKGGLFLMREEEKLASF